MGTAWLTRLAGDQTLSILMKGPLGLTDIRTYTTTEGTRTFTLTPNAPGIHRVWVYGSDPAGNIRSSKVFTSTVVAIEPPEVFEIFLPLILGGEVPSASVGEPLPAAKLDFPDNVLSQRRYWR